MAQCRCSIQNPISRGKGKSAVAKAAYNARDKIRDERTGELKNYSRSKDEVVFSGIFVDPKRNAPAWVQDREKLWNAASAAEKRKDAREAQEIILNLPHELTAEQRRFMLTDFVREHITRGTGRVADVNIHAAPKHGDDRNIHAHVLMTVREIGPEGFDGGKRLEADSKQILHWKQKWAERGAKELRKAGFEIEADRWAVGHLTLDRQRQAALERGDVAHAQSLDREPTKHLGPNVASMERKGVETDRGNVERETVSANLETAKLKSELAEIQKQIAAAEREAPLASTLAGSREIRERNAKREKPAPAETARGTLAGGDREKERPANDNLQRAEIRALAAMLQKQKGEEHGTPANDNEAAKERMLSVFRLRRKKKSNRQFHGINRQGRRIVKESLSKPPQAGADAPACGSHRP
jgi:MobA/MobL family protein